MKQEYTKEEILEFQKKDARIVAENALAHATQIVMGLGASGLDKFTLENVTKRVKETAAELFLWVYGQGELAVEHKTEKVTKEVVAPEVPVPQLEQKKILDMIAEKLTVTELTIRPYVNKWTLEITKGKQQYPTNTNSINRFIEWYEG